MNNGSKYLCVFFVVLAFTTGLSTVTAQEATNPKGVAFSFGLNELVGDFGMGLSIQSPLILDHAAIRAEGLLQWYNDPGSSEIWYLYMAARAGLAGYSSMLANFARLYGYGGIEFAFPGVWTDYIDTEAFRFGGFGGFGFEFFFIPTFCYYIELGTTGSGARSRFDPRLYRNGFQTTVGLRFYLQ